MYTASPSNERKTGKKNLKREISPFVKEKKKGNHRVHPVKR